MLRFPIYSIKCIQSDKKIPLIGFLNGHYAASDFKDWNLFSKLDKELIEKIFDVPCQVKQYMGYKIDMDGVIYLPVFMLWYNFHILVQYGIITPLIAKICSIEWMNWYHVAPLAKKFGMVLTKGYSFQTITEEYHIELLINTLKFKSLTMDSFLLKSISIDLLQITKLYLYDCWFENLRINIQQIEYIEIVCKNFCSIDTTLSPGEKSNLKTFIMRLDCGFLKPKLCVKHFIKDLDYLELKGVTLEDIFLLSESSLAEALLCDIDLSMSFSDFIVKYIESWNQCALKEMNNPEKKISRKNIYIYDIPRTLKCFLKSQCNVIEMQNTITEQRPFIRYSHFLGE